MNPKFTADFKPFTKLDEFFIIYLKSYFENHPEFPYTDDINSKISIQPAYSFESSEEALLPKLILQPGPYSLTNFNLLSDDIGGKTLAEFTQKRNYAYRAGAVYFLNILSKTQLQTRRLAEEIVVMIATYTDRIKEKFNITIEKVFDLQPEEPKIEGSLNIDFFTIRLKLVCSYIYYINTLYKPIYPKLADIDLVHEIDKKLETARLKFSVANQD